MHNNTATSAITTASVSKTQKAEIIADMQENMHKYFTVEESMWLSHLKEELVDEYWMSV